MSVARIPAGAPRVAASVAAFAAGHTAVLLAAPGVPHALLAAAEAELEAPMTAVIGADAAGGLAVLGLTELVPALLAATVFDDALRDALAAGLSVVVLAEAPGETPESPEARPA